MQQVYQLISDYPQIALNIYFFTIVLFFLVIAIMRRRK